MNFRQIVIAGLLIWGLVVLNRPTEDGKVKPVDGVASRVLIVRESRTQTPEMALALGGLRTGAARDWIEANKVMLQVNDPNAIEADGKPYAVVDRFKPYALPELLRLSPDGMKCIKRIPLPATTDAILTAIGKK